MAELADAHDSKSCGEIHVGSTPTLGTRVYEKYGWFRTFYDFSSIYLSIQILAIAGYDLLIPVK